MVPPREATKPDWDGMASLAESVVTEHAEFERLWRCLAPIAKSWIARIPGIQTWADEQARWDIYTRVWEGLQSDSFHKLTRFSTRLVGLRAEYAELSSGEYFRRWARRVVLNIAEDYKRTLPGYVRSRSGTEDSGEEGPADPTRYWRSIIELTTGKGATHDDVAERVVADRMLEYLDAAVPPRLRVAVTMAVEGSSGAAIADAVGSTVEDVDHLVEHGRRRLRYREALLLWCTSPAGQGRAGTHKVAEFIAETLGLPAAEDAERIVRAAKQLLRRRFAP